MKDLHTRDTYTRNFLNSIKKKLGYCPDTSHECAARLIRKCVKNCEKYTYWNLAKPGTYITCFKALTKKLTPGFPKMPKSHDQPLCAYLMRYDAIFNPIQDLDSSDTYTTKYWNPMTTIQVIVRTASTHDRTPRFIKKSVKNSGKTQILQFS